MFYGRGPEYRWIKRTVTIPAPQPARPRRGQRRTSPSDSSAGSIRPRTASTAATITSTRPGARTTRSPTEGVDPADMFRQVKGEGLNVGSVLTWGPGFDHQQQFFAPTADARSEPLTRDEVRHRGQRLRLGSARPRLPAQPEGTDLSGRDGQQGLADAGRCRCCGGRRRRGQSAATRIRAAACRSTPAAATTRLLEQLDANKDGRLDARRSRRAVCCRNGSTTIDTDRDGVAHEAGAQGEPRSRGRSAAELRHPRAEQRRRAGDLRDRRARRRRLHQRDGHRSDPRVERVVSPDEQRPSREGERRDRLPLHERHARRAGAQLRPARAR